MDYPRFKKILYTIRNNKKKFQKSFGIVMLGIGFRLLYLDLINHDLDLNSTQHVKQIKQTNGYINKNTQSANDNTIIVRTGSGVLISTQSLSKSSKLGLTIRSGDLSTKSEPDSRAKAHTKAQNNLTYVLKSMTPEKQQLLSDQQRGKIKSLPGRPGYNYSRKIDCPHEFVNVPFIYKIKKNSEIIKYTNEITQDKIKFKTTTKIKIVSIENNEE